MIWIDMMYLQVNSIDRIFQSFNLLIRKDEVHIGYVKKGALGWIGGGVILFQVNWGNIL
jgi:hypothetical protein